MQLLYQEDGQFHVLSLDHKEHQDSCRLVPEEALEGHVHEPGCGHEMISCGDHYAYLVEDRLHCVKEDGICCHRRCAGPKQKIVIEGPRLAVLVHKRFNRDLKEPLLLNDAPPLWVVETEGDMPDDPIVTRVLCDGICCPSEVPIVHKVLAPLEGVLKVEVNVVLQTVKVTHVPSQIPPGALVDALNGAHLSATLTQRHWRGTGGPWYRQLPPWHLLLSVLCAFLSFLHHVPEPPGFQYLKYLGLVSVAIGIWPILKRSWAAVRRLVMDVHVLMLAATAGAIALLDFSEAGAIVALFSVADWLEKRALSRAQMAIEEMMDLQQESATVAATGRAIPASAVCVGDQLLVKPGERFPVDGVVSRGSGLVDESMLTGESRPLRKGRLDRVLGGTINAGRSPLEVEATSTSEDSSAAVLAKLVEQASMERSSTERIVESFAKWYTPVVIAVALLVAVVPVAIGLPDAVDRYVYLALVLLVTACPCALVISTPVAAICGLARGAKEGILVKGAQHLETLAGIKVVTLDKTGTITEGRFSVERCDVLDPGRAEGVSLKEMLGLAASVEACAPHPLAAAVVAHAAAKRATISRDASGLVNHEGKGAVATVGGRQVYVGNRHLVKELSPGDVAAMEAYDTMDGTACWVGIDGRLAGCIVLADHTRPKAREAVEALRRAGVKVAMLTGDNHRAAAVVAKDVGLDVAEDVRAGLLPNEKLEAVRDYKERVGKLAHVGDGVNDAPALAAADIGIAMGVAGAAAAVAAANVSLFSTDLRKLATAMELSKVPFLLLLLLLL